MRHINIYMMEIASMNVLMEQVMKIIYAKKLIQKRYILVKMKFFSKEMILLRLLNQ